jgi:hypothetical protein
MDGIDGVGTNYSSFVPVLCSAKNAYVTKGWYLHARRLEVRFASKICDSLNPCAAHNN